MALNSKIGHFQGFVQNMVWTSPLVHICSGAPDYFTAHLRFSTYFHGIYFGFAKNSQKFVYHIILEKKNDIYSVSER